jgi:hypothetical protein
MSLPLIPIVGSHSEEFFVPAELIANRTEVVEGVSVTTRPLAFGKRLSLLSISSSQALLEEGIVDMTDSIKPAIRLARVWLNIPVAGRVLCLEIPNLPAPGFLLSWATEDYQEVVLDTAFQFKLSDPSLPGGVVATLRITGSILPELGDIEMHVAPASFAQGGKEDFKGHELFAGARFIGYELTAERVNYNRQRR